jgi:hypothetical protein
LRTRSVIAELKGDPVLHETFYIENMFHATSFLSLI